MKSAVVALSVVLGLGLVGIAVADGVIDQRRALMKQNDASFKEAAQLALGMKKPYDAAAAKAAMDKIVEDITTFPTLFPDDSKTGSQTAASPDIWTNKADFEAHAAKLKDDATAASAAAAAGVDAFKTAAMTVNADCKACHDKYRLEN